MGNKTIFSNRSATAFYSSHPGLQDIRLDESASDLSPAVKARPARFRNIMHEILFVVACSFASATFFFLQRSLAVIMDQLQRGLYMSPSELSWTVAGPGLSSGTLFLPMTLLAEHFRPISRRYTLAGSLLLYGLLAGICAASMDGIFLDVVVALAGATCALHLATLISILGSAYPYPSSRKMMATTICLVSGNPTAIIVGSMLSGEISIHFTWRGSFVFLAILSTLAAAFLLLVVPDFDRQPNLKPVAKEISDEEDASDELPAKAATTVCEIDWRGTILLILAVGLFTVALISAPETQDGWSTPYVWLLFAISWVCLGIFVFWEKVTEHPLVPPPVWDHPGLLFMLLFVFLISMAGCAVIFWVPLFMEQVQLQTSFQTAVRLLPVAISGLCISPLLVVILYRASHRLVAAVSAFCMIAGNVALMYLRSDSDYWASTFPAMVLSTVAMDCSVNVATVAFTSALPLHHQTTGLALVVTVARLAVPAGLAVTTAIHTSFAGRSDISYPEAPYTNVFYTTLSLSVLALTLVPFLRFDKRSSSGKDTRLSLVVNVDSSQDLGYRDFVENLPFFSIQPRKSSLCANQTKRANIPGPHSPAQAETGPSSHALPQSQRSSATGDRVIWLVCEDCGASKRMVERVGDPVRYFYDDGGAAAAAEWRAESGDTSSASTASTVRKIPLCKDLNSLRG